MSSNDRFPAGGDISDMAESGTTVPADAAVPRIIKSVPNPGMAKQLDDPDYNSTVDPEAAATNAVDIPRTTRDRGSTGEVETAGGQEISDSVETKRLNNLAGDKDLSKGHMRGEKYADQKGSDQERMASDGPQVDPAPGEEELSQETLQSRRDGL